jgi:hypothetical protein
LKILFIVAGIIIILFIARAIGYFNRLGAPVNKKLSDSYYYHSWKKKIIYSPMGNWFELGYLEMQADRASFVVVSRHAGKDSETVYWKGRKTQADAVSFMVDSNRIVKDKSHVYFPIEYPDSLFVIERADPKTYQALPVHNNLYYQYWATDASSIFLDGKKMEADRATFVRLNNTLAKDKDYVYSIEPSATIAIGNPGATILVRRENNPGGEATAINENYARIGNLIVLSNWKNNFVSLPFNAIHSVRVIDERNIVVNNTLLCDGKILAEIDVPSFEAINKDFFKDKNSVYYDSEKIPLADAQSFVVVHEEYSKDNQHVFYKLKVLEGANPAAFVINYGTGIATDGKLSFIDGELVTAGK